MRSGPSHLRKRRGVSTVAGAMFFIIIAVTIMVGLLLWSMEAQRQMSDLDTRRLSQRITVLDVAFPSPGVVNITVVNEGPEAVYLVAVWMVDKTNSTHYRVDLVEAYPPNGVAVNVGETVSFTISFGWVSGHTYMAKVITDLGRAFVYPEAVAP